MGFFMKRRGAIRWLALFLAVIFVLTGLPWASEVPVYAADHSHKLMHIRPEMSDDRETAAGHGELLAVEADDVRTEATADSMNLTAVSAILMEGSTGTVLYEKMADSEMPPASITKIMTLLLTFEALEKGQISLSDMVTVSEHAAGKGGSQVYLEPGETQTVEDMIKCISIASANDAATAMAEHIAGSEEAFAKSMNERAKALGMEHTNFVNCTGLDVENHYSSARDVALMSRELITRFPEISKYSTTWMDTIIHRTKRGESEFGLTNTNKLVRSYDGITGLKTGSTDKAKFCLSATAHRNDCDMIAVVMGCPSPKDRFQEAANLLNYGFANCRVYSHSWDRDDISPVPVKRGVRENVAGIQQEPFKHLFLNGENPENVAAELRYEEELEAPVKEGDRIGTAVYLLDGKELGGVPICAAEDVERAGYGFYLRRLLGRLTLQKTMYRQASDMSADTEVKASESTENAS